MGRAKVVMEPIENNKKRKITFLRRKEGIIKKAIELTTLCDVNVSMIVFTDSDQEPAEIFPPDNSHKFNSLIDLYRQRRTTDPTKVGSCNVSDFFQNRKIKIEEELVKAKMKNSEAKYPTWFDFLNGFSVGELRDFGLGLDGKIDRVKMRIESLKKILEIDDQNKTNPVIPMDYYKLVIEKRLKFLEELLMKDDDDFNEYDESLIGIPPPPLPLGWSFPPPMVQPPEAAPAPPAMHDKPFLVSDFSSQMMKYNNFGFDSVELSCSDHQCNLIVKQPSANPSFVTEMPMMRKDVIGCCNYDRNFSVQPPPVAYPFPPPQPPVEYSLPPPPQPPVAYSLPPPPKPPVVYSFRPPQPPVAYSFPPPLQPPVAYSFPPPQLQQPEAACVSPFFMFG